MEFLLRKAGYLPTEHEFKQQIERYRQLYHVFEGYLEENWKVYLQKIVSMNWNTPLELLYYVQKNPLPSNEFSIENVTLVNECGIWESDNCRREFDSLIQKLK